MRLDKCFEIPIRTLNLKQLFCIEKLVLNEVLFRNTSQTQTWYRPFT